MTPDVWGFITSGTSKFGIYQTGIRVVVSCVSEQGHKKSGKMAK